VTDLDLTAIPEADKALSVVKEWVFELFLSAKYARIGRQDFLTFIIELATLALRLEKAGAQRYFNSSPCITMERPQEYIRNGNMYIVDDLLHFLCRKNINAMSAGVVFIQ
jgi:hypothetical protein